MASTTFTASSHKVTVTDMRMSMLRNYTEAQISELLGQIKGEAWAQGLAAATENGYLARNGKIPNPYMTQP